MKNLIDRKTIYTNLIILGLGIIFGIIFLIFTSSLDKEIVKTEITDFISSFNGNTLSLSNFFNSFNFIFNKIIIFNFIYKYK